jgi:LmbE family N-acetylglucosaminyl deacetylase
MRSNPLFAAAFCSVVASVGIEAPPARAEAPLATADRIMLVVAHQDDDIGVAVPDLVPAFRQQRAIQTVYLTSGDAGFTCNAYTQGREQGAKAVHAALAGVPNRWLDEERQVRGKRVRFSRLAGTQHSLAFIGLPNPGFLSVTPPEGALQRLWLRQLPSVDTVPYDGRSGIDTYAREDLIEVLRTLMSDFTAKDVRVLDASQQQIPIYPFEHVDHMGSAMFATAAFDRYARADALTFYPLYSVQFKPANLPPDMVTLRRSMFDLYRQYDPKPCDTVTTTVCGAPTNCDPLSIYDPFYSRSYPEDTLRSGNAQIRTPSGLCFEAVGASVAARLCDRTRSVQTWALERGGVVRNLATGQCMASATASSGELVALKPCARGPNQQFYVTTQRQLRGPDATCVRESFGSGVLSECVVDIFQLGFGLQ